jgi:ComF family protein
MIVMKLKDIIKRLVAVRKCGGCGEILDHEHFEETFCDRCQLKWRIAKAGSCPICNQSAIECTCMSKGLAKTGALCLRKLYFYSPLKNHEAQNRILYSIKKKQNKRFSRFLASEISPLAMDELSVLEVENKDAVIVHVPRGRRAKACYGFDQSELICKEMSRITGIPHVAAIARNRKDREQKKLDKSRRFRNVQSSFAVSDEESVKNKYVLLFDDVVTTGASMAACTSILKKAGAKGIICLCIAQD